MKIEDLAPRDTWRDQYSRGPMLDGRVVNGATPDLRAAARVLYMIGDKSLSAPCATASRRGFLFSVFVGLRLGLNRLAKAVHAFPVEAALRPLCLSDEPLVERPIDA